MQRCARSALGLAGLPLDSARQGKRGRHQIWRQCPRPAFNFGGYTSALLPGPTNLPSQEPQLFEGMTPPKGQRSIPLSPLFLARPGFWGIFQPFQIWPSFTVDIRHGGFLKVPIPRRSSKAPPINFRIALMLVHVPMVFALDRIPRFLPPLDPNSLTPQSNPAKQFDSHFKVWFEPSSKKNNSGFYFIPVLSGYKY